MPTQSEIDRILVLLYRSDNAHDFVNFSRPYGWLDKLPMSGLKELAALLEHMRDDVDEEINNRLKDGMPRYPREDHAENKPWTK